MNTENKILISDICSALQAIEHYPNPERAFRIGWEGWRSYCLRHGKHSKTFFTFKWNDGWLSKEDALDFCNYLIEGWKPVFV